MFYLIFNTSFWSIAQHNNMQGASPSPGQEPFHTTTSQDASGPSALKAKWWKVHLFRGMVKDIKRRVPYYWSDWLDAWDYRVVPATVYMFFAKCVCSYLATYAAQLN